MRTALTVILLLATESAHAQATVAPGGVTLQQEHDVPSAPQDVAEEFGADGAGDASGTADPSAPEAARLHKGHELVVVPLPGYDPQQGWKLTLPAMILYRPTSAGPGAQVWITGLMGMYTENESWAGSLFHRMNLANDTWRFMGALAHADVNYDYFGHGETSGIGTIPISQDIDIASAKVLYRVWPHFYAGLKLVYAKSAISLNIPEDRLPDGIEPGDLAIDIDLIDVVPRVEYDTRDHEFYPTRGAFVEAQVAISRESLGSDADFEKYVVKANYYRSIGTGGVLAGRVRTDFASDGAPFFVIPAFGSDADLRGYKSGTYRDNFLLAAQAEYRHRFGKFGAVAFAGVGTVAEDPFEWDESLYSYGFGGRYVVGKINNISVRVDVAWGKDDHQVYVGIGEAF